MIIGTFSFAQERNQVVVDGNNLFFIDMNGMTTTIEGLKIDKIGVVKEFPDLKEDENWKIKAIERLKEHIKKFKTEKEKMYYIKDELIKFGHEPILIQRAGFRPQKF